jgi:hypothetical protein
LSFDAFASQAMLDDVPPRSPEFDGLGWAPRPWSPQDDLNLTDWLQRRGIEVNDTVAAKAVETVARDNTFHPVVDYLEGLKHDGKARLGTWLRIPMISPGCTDLISPGIPR